MYSSFIKFVGRLLILSFRLEFNDIFVKVRFVPTKLDKLDVNCILNHKEILTR